MKKTALLACAIILISACTAAAATFRVEQYDVYLGTDLSAYQTYAGAHEADTVAYVDRIDFTDDPSGFDGVFANSSPWPTAAAAGASGRNASENTQFFARITASFLTTQDRLYWFQTFNDDGVFLFVNDRLIINDPNLHGERRFFGISYLQAGQHDLELYFFENGGAASLELSFSPFLTAFSQTGGSDVVFVPLPPAGSLLGLSALLLVVAQTKKRSSGRTSA